MIIAAQTQHVKDVYQLICLLENEVFEYKQFEKVYQENLNDNNIYYFIYTKQEKIIGFVSLYIKNALHHNGDIGEILELIVDESYRGQQIGLQLLNHVIQTAKEMNLLELELSSNMKRLRAHSFYEKHGFIKNHYNFIYKIKN